MSDPYEQLVLHARRVTSYELSAAHADGSLTGPEYDAAGAEVERLCLGGLVGDAEHHASAVRFNLGKPWDLRGKRWVYDWIRKEVWA